MQEPGRTMPDSLSLSEQVHYLLRRTHQRASAVFMESIGDAQMTPTQWAALVALNSEGTLSQNQLGRLTFMDPATTQGVILRLAERNLVEREPDPRDRRRTSVRLTRAGRNMVEQLRPNAEQAHALTLAPLSSEERDIFLRLLTRLL